MKYEPIDSQIFIENRKRLYQQLKPQAIAVCNANDIMPTSADGTMPFRQHSDIFYLSGIDQEESILLMYPDSPAEKHREILFLKETNEKTAIWEGAKLTKNEAQAVSGIQTVYWLDAFESVFSELAFRAEKIYLNTNEHLRNSNPVETRDKRFLRWCMEQYPLHRYERLAPIMHHLRAIKSSTEVALIQQACDITEKAFRRVLKFVQPGVWEYAIEAEIFHEFIRNRSRGPAYDSIIASGLDSCVLHYIKNNKQCQSGDVLLMDFGAEYANYCADLTRTIPVSGKFTARQRDVYNAVLNVQKAAINMLRPGNTLEEYHQEVGKIMEGKLIDLGLLNKKDVAKQDANTPLYSKYFMHGTSHHLGLNVHDYGQDMYRPFEADMVFTCEPGIYIREESLGVRIENDILVTNSQPIDLMKNIPVEAEEIEECMNAGK